MDAIYRENEMETNEAAAKAVLFVTGFVLLAGVFCWAGIFNVYHYIINSFILASLLPLFLPILVVNILHISKKWVKYMIIVCIALLTGIAYTIFTFQTVIIFVIPSIIASFYLDKRVMLFTGAFTSMVIAAAHLVTGFHLFQPWIEPFRGLKQIMLYGALPRIMQYLVCTLLLYLLCKRFMKFLHGFHYALEDEKRTSDYKILEENLLNGFTEREKEVFELLVQGYTNAQIAQRLYLSNGTVKNYVSAIYDKIGIKDRMALVLKYSEYYKGHDQSHT